MDKPKMYLKKRNGWFVFRRPIPKALQQFLPTGCRTEFIASLKTKDRNAVSRPYSEALRESERILGEALFNQKAANGRKASVPNDGTKQTNRLSRRPLHEFSQTELHLLIHRWYLKAKEQALEQNRFIFTNCGHEDREHEVANLDDMLACLEKRNGANPDLETYRQCRKLIEEAGGFVNWRHPATFIKTNSWFTALVRECLISLNRYARSILETGTAPIAELAPPEFGSATGSNSGNRLPSISLDELMKQFDNDPNRTHLKQKTRDEFLLVYRMLRESIGGNTPVASITRAQIKNLQDLYRQLPARFSAIYPNKELRDVVKLAKRDNRPPMERATFNKRMTMLSSIFGYAMREQLLASSPADGLTMRDKKKVEGEKSFSVDQLKAIFSGPIFQEFTQDYPARFTPKHRLNPHEFWTPLLALFQGLRMEEILQLRIDDVGEQDRTPCIYIREGEGQSVKTDASLRIVPIHPELDALGFLRYVAAVRKAGLGELFSEATRGRTYGNRSHNYSKRFNRYLAQIGVKKGRNQVFHSFRHTFADGLRVVDVPQDALRRLAGWTDASSSETLYGGRILPYLRQQLAKLKYEGLDLSHLISKS